MSLIRTLSRSTSRYAFLPAIPPSVVVADSVLSRGDEPKPDQTRAKTHKRRPSLSDRLLRRNTSVSNPQYVHCFRDRPPSNENVRRAELGVSQSRQDGDSLSITGSVVASGLDATDRYSYLSFLPFETNILNGHLFSLLVFMNAFRTIAMPRTTTRRTRTNSLPVVDLVLPKYPVMKKNLMGGMKEVMVEGVRMSRIRDPIYREFTNSIMEGRGEKWTRSNRGPSETVISSQPEPRASVNLSEPRASVELSEPCASVNLSSPRTAVQKSPTPDVPRSPAPSTIFDRDSFTQGSRGIPDTGDSEGFLEGHRLSFASVPVSHAHALKRVASLDNVVYAFADDDHYEQGVDYPDAVNFDDEPLFVHCGPRSSLHESRSNSTSRAVGFFPGEEPEQARGDLDPTMVSQHSGQRKEGPGLSRLSGPSMTSKPLPTLPSCSVVTDGLRSSRRSTSSPRTSVPDATEYEEAESVVSWVEPPAYLWARSSEGSGSPTPIAAHPPRLDEVDKRPDGHMAHESGTTLHVSSTPLQTLILPAACPQKLSPLSDAPSPQSDTTIGREVAACLRLASANTLSVYSEASVYSQDTPVSSGLPRNDTPPLRITKSRPAPISVPSRASTTSVGTQESGGSSDLRYAVELYDELATVDFGVLDDVFKNSSPVASHYSHEMVSPVDPLVIRSSRRRQGSQSQQSTTSSRSSSRKSQNAPQSSEQYVSSSPPSVLPAVPSPVKASVHVQPGLFLPNFVFSHSYSYTASQTGSVDSGIQRSSQPSVAPAVVRSSVPSLPDIASSRKQDSDSERTPISEVSDARRSSRQSSTSVAVTVPSTGRTSSHSRHSSCTVGSTISSWVDVGVDNASMHSDERPQSSPSPVPSAKKTVSRSRQGSDSGKSTAPLLCPSSPVIAPLSSPTPSGASSHRRQGSHSGSTRSSTQHPSSPMPSQGASSQVEYTRDASTRRPSVSSPLSSPPFDVVAFRENSQRKTSARATSTRRPSMSSTSSHVSSQVQDTYSHESGRRLSVSSAAPSLPPKDEIMSTHNEDTRRDVSARRPSVSAFTPITAAYPVPRMEGTRRDVSVHRQSVSSSSPPATVSVHSRASESSHRRQESESRNSTTSSVSTPPPCSGVVQQEQEHRIPYTATKQPQASHVPPTPATSHTSSSTHRRSESVKSTTSSNTRSSSRCSADERRQDSAQLPPSRKASRLSHAVSCTIVEPEPKSSAPSVPSLVHAPSQTTPSVCKPSQTGTVAALVRAFEAASQPPSPEEKLPAPIIPRKPLHRSPSPVHATSQKSRPSSVSPIPSPKSTTCSILRSSSDSEVHDILRKDQTTQTPDDTLAPSLTRCSSRRGRTSRTKQTVDSSLVSAPSQPVTHGRGDSHRAPKESTPDDVHSRSSRASHRRKKSESSRSNQSTNYNDASVPTYAVAREGEAKCSDALSEQNTTQSRSTTLSSSPPRISSPRRRQTFSSRQVHLPETLPGVVTKGKPSDEEDVSWYKMKLDAAPICLRQLVGEELQEATRLDNAREKREKEERRREREGRREKRSKSRGQDSIPRE
ncbi:hypothetical protein PHLCEN_2v307 [Hermanssonia centrifuga]|uniref:Uncharacterized protein n=1 Tax=Hermanssonia centrifuga TaxID=98765 RepID=A0A2R6S6K5_9APHY|nr:hypothetical protein PHLCEN_2v307 [Hermanssonia centrifuga]